MSNSEDLVPCRMCYGGEWWTECCSGSGGCSCQGQPINMGTCNVCGGSGYHPPDTDIRRNIRTIDGFGYIGTGPRSGLYADLPRMGYRP